MVLSLVELSLRTITNGIKYGTIRHPHLLPPKLRKWVLDKAIKKRVANHPNGMEILTSVEFLTGMTSITAEVCNKNDLEFLERLISSLATKLPDGETVGAAVEELNITVDENEKNEKLYSKVSDLIGHCPNTASLDLHIRQSLLKRVYWPLNDNGNSACHRVMENLIKLSVVSSGCYFLNSERPILNFKQLTTLKLEHCYIDNGSWYKLLEKIPFVENLHFFEVSTTDYGLDWTLLSKLPHLKSLKVLGSRYILKCNKIFVNTLMECQKLRQVYLKLDEKSTDEESFVRLANLDIDLKIEIRLFFHSSSVPDFDSSSRFKIVSIFHERVESFELEVQQQWNAQFSMALEDVFNTCSNLTSFGIRQDRIRVNQPQIEFEGTKLVNAALVRFFSNPQRALQLKRLSLVGNFDVAVLSAVFENCPNLVRLDIRECPNLRDQHLIDWVSGGCGKLTELIVEQCNNVTSEGVIPVLARSGESLLRYQIRVKQVNGRNWRMVLPNHCPNAVS